MLLPALSKAREKARSISCVNKLKQFGLADNMYAADNNDFLVTYDNFTYVFTNLIGSSGTKPFPRLMLGGYMGGSYSDYSKITTKDWENHFKCPSDSVNFDATHQSYFWLYIEKIPGTGNTATSMPYGWDATMAAKGLRAIVGRDNPGACIMADPTIGQVGYYGASYSWVGLKGGSLHNNQVNAVYLDGHCKSVKTPSDRYGRDVGYWAVLMDEIDYGSGAVPNN